MFVEGTPGCTCARSREHASLPPEHPQHPRARAARVPPPMRLLRSLLRNSPQTQPGPLGQFESNCGRRSSADPGPLSSSVPTACGRTTGPRPATRREDGPARPRSHLPGRLRSRPSRGSSASARPRGASSEPGLGPPPSARGLGPPPPRAGGTAQATGTPVRGPAASAASSALSPQTPESRRAPGAPSGTRGAEPLTWKCSAIFPGGGAGPRPQSPRGGSGGGRRGSPSRPRGPCAACWLARSAPQPRGLRVPGAGGAGPGVRGGATGRGGPKRAGPRERESQLSSALPQPLIPPTSVLWHNYHTPTVSHDP